MIEFMVDDAEWFVHLTFHIKLIGIPESANYLLDVIRLFPYFQLAVYNGCSYFL